jgi:hypothetical protein
VEYNQAQHAALKQFQTDLYTFDQDQRRYRLVSSDWEQMQCGPGYGMISRVGDLIKYSNSLNENEIIKAESYQRLTTPFYQGSPYGLGGFTTAFEGYDLHWGYGYGDYDSAIFIESTLQKPYPGGFITLLDSFRKYQTGIWQSDELSNSGLLCEKLST